MTYCLALVLFLFFFSTDTATTEIYTLSLHDALPILSIAGALAFISLGIGGATMNIYTQVGLVTLMGLISKHGILIVEDRKSTRLNSSHTVISYAVFCLKKKKIKQKIDKNMHIAIIDQ